MSTNTANYTVNSRGKKLRDQRMRSMLELDQKTADLIIITLKEEILTTEEKA